MSKIILEFDKNTEFWQANTAIHSGRLASIMWELVNRELFDKIENTTNKDMKHAYEEIRDHIYQELNIAQLDLEDMVGGE